MSAAQFLESLFGALPEFFRDEDKLRAIWSAPDTRKALLAGLADKGFGFDQMADMQKIIDAEHSDLFDVLAFVAFAQAPIALRERADSARLQVHQDFNDKQHGFLDFVLSRYEKEGVQELDQGKLSPLRRLRYSAIGGAVTDLGGPDPIRELFVGFQKDLYEARP